MISVGDMGVFRGEFKFAQVQNDRVSIIIVWDGSAPNTKNRNMVKDLTDAKTIMASICNSVVPQDIVRIDGQCIFVNEDGENTWAEIEISCLADLALVHLAHTRETVVRITDNALFSNACFATWPLSTLPLMNALEHLFRLITCIMTRSKLLRACFKTTL